MQSTTVRKRSVFRRSDLLAAHSVALVAALMHFTESNAADMALIPSHADGPFSIVDNEITIPAGGVRVFLDVYISGWAPAELGVYQAGMSSDGSAFSGGTAGSLGFAQPACTGIANLGNCDELFGAPGSETNCFAVDSRCAPAYIENRPDHVFYGILLDSGVGGALPPEPWSLGAITHAGVGAPDPGAPRYGGTFVVEVSPGAAGSFTVNLCRSVDCPSYTYMNNSAGSPIPVSVLGARITMGCETNADCDDADLCTTDTCVGYQCQHVRRDCDDGQYCTLDVCTTMGCYHEAWCGACCDSGGGCSEILSGTPCSGTFLDGIRCGPGVCESGGDTGACCNLTACTNVSSAAACAGGTFFAGGSCSPGFCTSASDTIGPGGGTLETADGSASVDFPPACVGTSTAMSMEWGNWPDRIFDVLVQGGPGRAMASYTFEPSGLDFCDTAELCITVDLARSLLTASDCSSVSFQFREGTCNGSPGTDCRSDAECGGSGPCNFTYTTLPQSRPPDCSDPANARFCAYIGHFSDYGLVGPDSGSIPTVSEWGVVALTLLLLVGGKVYYRRVRAAT